MNKSDAVWFAKQLERIGLATGTTIEKEAMRVYFSMMEEMSQEKFEIICNEIMKSWTYQKFPPVGYFFEVSRKLDTNVSEYMWIKVLDLARRFGTTGFKRAEKNLDQTARNAIKKVGWSRICLTDYNQNKFLADDFKRAYLAERGEKVVQVGFKS